MVTHRFRNNFCVSTRSESHLKHTILRYSGFVLESVKRELYLKFLGSALGPAWLFITPLATLALFIGVFGYALRGKVPGASNPDDYWIFLCAGLLPWQLFSDIVLRGQSLYVDNMAVLKKIAIPKLILPMILVINALIQFAIIASIFLLALVVVDRWPGWAIISAAPIILGYVLFAAGAAMTLAPTNVFFRDVAPATTLILLFCFWATPIVYSLKQGGNAVSDALLQFNPFAWASTQMQEIFVHGEWANNGISSGFFSVSVLVFAFGLLVFTRSAALIADEL